jgi:hypothetical protein
MYYILPLINFFIGKNYLKHGVYSKVTNYLGESNGTNLLIQHNSKLQPRQGVSNL